MSGLKLRTLMVLVVSLLLHGCIATKQNFTKDTLNTQGLVLAEVIMLNSFGEVSSITGIPAFTTGDIRHSMENGHMVVSLPPGKNRLISITTHSGSLRTTYSINLEFDVRAGSVTNLGKLMLLSEDKAGSTRYRIISVENNKQMLSYVRNKYPEAFGSLSGKVNPLSFKQLSAKDMDKFQVEIARRKLVMGKNTIKLDNRNYVVYGGLGSLVKFTMSKDLKKFTGVKALKTGTLDPILACDAHNKTVACLTNSQTADKLLVARGSKVSSRKLTDNSYSQLFFERNGSIVLMNNKYAILRSNNLGKSWKLDKRFYNESGSSKWLKTAQGLNGFFLYKEQENEPVLKYNRSNGQFSKLDIAFDEDHLTNILETRNGIFVGPEYTLFTDSKLFYQKSANANWQELVIPHTGCSSLKSLDRGVGKHLQLTCQYGIKVESRDGGTSWKKVDKS